MNYTHASLFSGIGGAELAASWLGWTNVFHCEIQEFQRKVLEYWFPNSISYEDITKTDFKEWRGQIDVLTGGFPCQPFSVAGKRKGAEDNRYLWGEMLRAIRQIKPTWVVGENVNGLLSMVQPGEEVEMGRADDFFEENYIYRTEQKFTIDAICEDLAHAGYSVQPLVIPACAVAAPHKRDRVWIVAHRADPRLKSMRRERKDSLPKSQTSPHSEIAGSERKLLIGWKFRKYQRKEAMNSKEFFESVCELRRWQREYAKTRRTEAARKAKRLEQVVDAEIARVCDILGAATKQPNIFNK